MILFFVLISTSISPLRFEVAKASGTIYIMADGSVDPPTTPIQRTDNTYTLTNDLYEPIVVKRDYIIIDGAGFTVEGTGDGRGIDISGRTYVTIKNANIKGFSTGVYLYQLSSYNSIIGNNITNCSLASLLDYDANYNTFSNNNLEGSISLGQVSNNNKIYGNNFVNGSIHLHMVSNNNNISKNNVTSTISIDRSKYNIIEENNITTHDYTFGISLMSSSNNSILRNTFSNGGLWVHESYDNSVENNSVNGKPLVYLENVSNYTVDNAGQVILVKCRDIIVQNLDLSRALVGIEMLGTVYSEISHNNITNNAGIELWHSANNNISANNITNNECGIYLINSANNSISRNNITGNGNGVHLDRDSNYNAIFGNDIMANTHYGISHFESESNSVFHNNFAENQNHVSTGGIYGNFWDDGLEGNFWNDYNGTDSDHDGIGDTPYPIEANNIDNYPLMGKFHSFDVSWVDSGYFVDLISNSTISDFEVGILSLEEYPYARFIGFFVAGENDTVGFCRVLIPTALMDGTYRILVNGTEVPSNLLPCSNSTHSYLYFNYTHSTQEVIIIPELPSLLILPLFTIATLLTVIIWRKNCVQPNQTLPANDQRKDNKDRWNVQNQVWLRTEG
jgi:parallel beta-helix repeat protein